jgi:hypothetical protein
LRSPCSSPRRAAAKPPDTAKLARQGVHVTWPLTQSVTLSPRHFLSVPVRSRRMPVTVSLLRVDRHGRIMRVLKRETLRNGRFESFAYGVPGARLSLRLDVAGKRYWSWIQVGDDHSPRTISCEHGIEVTPPEGAHDFMYEVPRGLAAGRYRLRLWTLPPLEGWEREVTVAKK